MFSSMIGKDVFFGGLPWHLVLLQGLTGDKFYRGRIWQIGPCRRGCQWICSVLFHVRAWSI